MMRNSLYLFVIFMICIILCSCKDQRSHASNPSTDSLQTIPSQKPKDTIVTAPIPPHDSIDGRWKIISRIGEERGDTTFDSTERIIIKDKIFSMEFKGKVLSYTIDSILQVHVPKNCVNCETRRYYRKDKTGWFHSDIYFNVGFTEMAFYGSGMEGARDIFVRCDNENFKIKDSSLINAIKKECGLKKLTIQAITVRPITDTGKIIANLNREFQDTTLLKITYAAITTVTIPNFGKFSFEEFDLNPDYYKLIRYGRLGGDLPTFWEYFCVNMDSIRCDDILSRVALRGAPNFLFSFMGDTTNKAQKIEFLYSIDKYIEHR